MTKLLPAMIHRLGRFLTSDGDPVGELPIVLQREHLLVLQRPNDELRQQLDSVKHELSTGLLMEGSKNLNQSNSETNKSNNDKN